MTKILIFRRKQPKKSGMPSVKHKPIRWTLERAAIEFGTSPPTLGKALAQAGINARLVMVTTERGKSVRHCLVHCSRPNINTNDSQFAASRVGSCPALRRAEPSVLPASFSVSFSSTRLVGETSVRVRAASASVFQRSPGYCAGTEQNLVNPRPGQCGN